MMCPMFNMGGWRSETRVHWEFGAEKEGSFAPLKHTCIVCHLHNLHVHEMGIVNVNSVTSGNWESSVSCEEVDWQKPGTAVFIKQQLCRRIKPKGSDLKRNIATMRIEFNRSSIDRRVPSSRRKFGRWPSLASSDDSSSLSSTQTNEDMVTHKDMKEQQEHHSQCRSVRFNLQANQVHVISAPKLQGQRLEGSSSLWYSHNELQQMRKNLGPDARQVFAHHGWCQRILARVYDECCRYSLQQQQQEAESFHGKPHNQQQQHVSSILREKLVHVYELLNEQEVLGLERLLVGRRVFQDSRAERRNILQQRQQAKETSFSSNQYALPDPYSARTLFAQELATALAVVLKQQAASAQEDDETP